jgi:predicted 3-demethylubiquinone-9 3-methyltransferase (glyoxalase superfamily)
MPKVDFTVMQKITPFLWFDDKADEAVNFYISVFKNSRITSITRYGEVPGPKGKVMSLTYELEGQEFMALNGGPGVFTFSGAISFFVKCKTQKEVDYFWEKLSEGGEKQQCGWLRDKYGVTWQVVPTILGEMLNDSDPEKVKRVTEAMLKMKKIEIDELKKAYKQQ